MIPAGFESLIAAPSAATLTVYRSDGEAVTSPVWFRLSGDHVEMVIAATDSKVGYLRVDPRCVLLIFESKSPFRGLRIRGQAELMLDDGSTARKAIASRYLGAEAGAQYADLGTRRPGFVLRLPLSGAKTWDLSATLPHVAESE